jgi:hypothetical protein
MPKRLLAIVIIIALAIAMLSAIPTSRANFTPLPELPKPIYITENGTIEGGNGAIQRVGDIYTFVRHINETIEVQKDNIIIDGNGFSIMKLPEVNTEGLMTPTGWFPSIRIPNRDNITIRNIKFDKCFTSISVDHSSNIVIIQNIIRNGMSGICMSSSVNCSIIANEIVDNFFSGFASSDSSFLDIAYNTIAGNGWHGAWVTISYSNIYRNNITNNNGSNYGIGIYCYGTNSNNNIFENNFIKNDIGVSCQKGSNNNLYSNYWNNSRKEFSGNIFDKSPLASPISISFDPSLFPWLHPTTSPMVEQPNPSEEPAPTPEPKQLEPFPTTLVTASIVSIAVIGIGLLVYFRRRKGTP